MSYDRRERIRELLEKKEMITLKELELEFPTISSMTIRRDLEYLESMGEAIRVRGGARSIKRLHGKREPAYNQRAAENIDAKLKIASLAAKYIETGRSVFLDSGSTIMELAKIMPDLNLSLLTSDPKIALEIVNRYNPTVNLIGGVLSHGNQSVSGMHAAEFVQNFNIDLAFVVPSAFSVEEGFSCGNSSECEIKRSIFRKSRKIILLIDSTKFDKNLPFTFGRLNEIDILITDKKPDERYMEEILANNIELIY